MFSLHERHLLEFKCTQQSYILKNIIRTQKQQNQTASHYWWETLEEQYISCQSLMNVQNCLFSHSPSFFFFFLAGLNPTKWDIAWLFPSAHFFSLSFLLSQVCPGWYYILLFWVGSSSVFICPARLSAPYATLSCSYLLSFLSDVASKIPVNALHQISQSTDIFAFL